ncbi:MAG: DHH family phosphoesterase, partial [Candidatus Aenigmarchaeota archaeon]|nr:DHH family phosphoesterase [Candidatus Aenigmarchaeota archaeon]
VFVDLGSGQLEKISSYIDNNKIIVLDHHHPAEKIHPNIILHLNAHLLGMDGSREISGSGMCYLFSKYFIQNNELHKKMEKIAIIGMMGDMQLRDAPLGMNKKILSWAEDNGVVDIKKDICYFGKQTRPIYKLLEYATDPILPTISFNTENSKAFVNNVVNPRDKDNFWKRWIDLNNDELQQITTNLIKLILSYNNGSARYTLNQLFCDTYQFLDETKGTELRDVMEFSTVLNACGRHDKWKDGVELILGNRENMPTISTLLENHRRALAESIDIIKKTQIKRMKNIQVVSAGSRIKSTIIGTVVGMALGAKILYSDLPVIALSDDSDNPQYSKVSSRGTKRMIFRGLKLNKAMNLSEKFGGEGGGHDIAAGCSIPNEKIDEFLDAVDKCVGEQMKQ